MSSYLCLDQCDLLHARTQGLNHLAQTSAKRPSTTWIIQSLKSNLLIQRSTKLQNAVRTDSKTESSLQRRIIRKRCQNFIPEFLFGSKELAMSALAADKTWPGGGTIIKACIIQPLSLQCQILFQ